MISARVPAAPEPWQRGGAWPVSWGRRSWECHQPFGSDFRAVPFLTPAWGFTWELLSQTAPDKLLGVWVGDTDISFTKSPCLGTSGFILTFQNG